MGYQCQRISARLHKKAGAFWVISTCFLYIMMQIASLLRNLRNPCIIILTAAKYISPEIWREAQDEKGSDEL